MAWHAVAKVGQLQAGDVIGLEVEGVSMIVGRDGERYFAMQRQCVHQGGDLADGIVSRGHVICANHGWRFSTATGRHDSSSDACLVTYAVRVNGETIEVDPVPRTLRGY
ncbi:MAG TPA: Rieske 2Fe-2S domain-containing protein [Kofleriaceae bacterium]|nr:Rieske 2Fe-2S domain-containing protein [Kofleriaceae bacterium]